MSEGVLAGRRVLVTGAARGIGRAIVELFLREGAAVAALDAAEQPDTDCAGFLPLCCDVRDDAAVAAAVRLCVDGLGGLDGVVNAAGVHVQGSLAETTPALFRDALDVNLTGPFMVCREAAPHLLAAKDEATIVNLSSASALSTFANRSAYAASKGGLIAMSKSMARELAPRVRVNVLAPGLVDTPMGRAASGGDIGAVAQRYALRRVGRVEEVAQAALYLSGPASSFVTGVTLAVDGGRSFH